MNRPNRRQLFVALFGLLCASVLIALEMNDYFLVNDARLTDKLTAPRPASTDIVIIAIDDKSIQEFGVWPWPRSLHAQMIDILTNAGAKAIGYDVTFSETSNSTDDAQLVTALNAASNNGRVTLATEPGLNLFPALAEVRPLTGSTAVITDKDGIVRSAEIAASFAKRILQGPTYFENLKYTGDILHIPFVGPPSSFKTVSFLDVVNGAIKPNELKNKIILVGATATDLHDDLLVPTSHGQAMAGVEVHANIIQALQENRNLRALTSTNRTIFLLVLAVIIMTLSMMLRLRYLVVTILGILISYLLLVVGFSLTDLLLPVTAPLLLIVLFGGVDVVSRYLDEQGRRRFIHNAFAHYLAPQVIEKLVRGETALELGGSKRELTILFSDIRGFTSLSEKLPPEELVPFLNEYLTAMTDIVLDSEGVVDKYIGDAIMAFWGAPIPQADHAVRSAMTAVLMKRKLAELQAGWSKTGKPSIAIGIGLNTGEVIVGNMGSRQRFDYTVIGDDVNLASRLEGLTKQYGVTTIISESTKNKLDNKFVTRELDLVAVKGRTQPVRIFELVEEFGRVDKPTTQLITEFEKALKLYRAQKWAEATRIFEQLAKTDKPSAVFLDRTRYLKDHLPDANWDGSFTAKEK